jgi:hypothetical protein
MKDSKFEKIQDIILDIIITMAMILLFVGFVVLGIVVVGKFSHREIIINPQAPTISEEEKYFDQLTEDIIKCESSGIENAVGDGGLAYGVAQFHRETFNWMCKLSGKNLNYYNAQDQKELLRWALENGYQRHWTCYSKVKGF